MRIVSGQYGRRKLFTPKNNDIRPTSDKVRGAIFNILASRMDLSGAHVMDAFCGSGALGLEALSRGAAHCTFIDKARASLALAQENADMLGVSDDMAQFMLKDTSKIALRPNNIKLADLIFLDPPYNKGLITAALEALHAGDWIANDAWIVCESERGLDMPKGFTCEAEKIYGDTLVAFLLVK